jgi:hypothetical protein
MQATSVYLSVVTETSLLRLLLFIGRNPVEATSVYLSLVTETSLLRLLLFIGRNPVEAVFVYLSASETSFSSLLFIEAHWRCLLFI